MRSRLLTHLLTTTPHRSYSISSTPTKTTLAHLIRTGHLRQAQLLFDSLPAPTTLAYNSLISAYARHCDLHRARHLFDKMPHRDIVSYNAMLSAYALSNASYELAEGRNLFDRMPMRDPISWNTMINAYARNGRMEDAMELFHRMPHPNVVTWNTLISGFFKVGNVKRAVDLFERMPDRDSASLCTLVSGLVKNGKLEEAEEILLRRGSEIEGAVDAYNTLIAGYGQCGRVEEAQTLFYLIPKDSSRFRRNVVSWNSMIMCYLKGGDVRSARELFDKMPEKDMVSWNTMINGYVQAGEMDQAVKLFGELKNPDSWTYNSIICGLAREGKLEKAWEVFNRMSCKTLVSWNAMLAGYEQNGDYEGAINLFAQMQAIGERPDKHTLSSVLSACAGIASFHVGVQIHQLISKRIISDTPINNALITMYSRCGSVIHAKAVFDEMGMDKRDVVSWNAMIGGFAQHGHAKRALEIFDEMKRVNVRPTYITFVAVLNACVHAGLVDEGKREFDSMLKECGISPRVEHYALLVDLLGRHGQLEDAMKVIKEMVEPPDKAVWGALLNAARIHNNVKLAEVATKALAKVDPNSSAPYVMLYNVHADEGRWGDAMEARELMDRCGIVKKPGYSWIEVKDRVEIFVAGDWSRPLSFEIFTLLDGCDRISRERDIQA